MLWNILWNQPIQTSFIRNWSPGRAVIAWRDGNGREGRSTIGNVRSHPDDCTFGHIFPPFLFHWKLAYKCRRIYREEETAKWKLHFFLFSALFPLFEIRFLSQPQVPILVFFNSEAKNRSIISVSVYIICRALSRWRRWCVCVWLLTLLLATLNGSYFSPSLLLGEEC